MEDISGSDTGQIFFCKACVGRILSYIERHPARPELIWGLTEYILDGRIKVTLAEFTRSDIHKIGMMDFHGNEFYMQFGLKHREFFFSHVLHCEYFRHGLIFDIRARGDEAVSTYQIVFL